MNLVDFYTDTTNFTKYGTEHFMSILVVAIIGILFCYYGKYRWNEEQRWRNAIIFSSILLFIQLFKTFIRIYLGNIDYSTDLPLQLCNILPLLMIIGLKYRSRTVLSVMFFWILAGTIQANITPTLENELPHYEAIRYWAIHTGLPFLAIYTFYVLEYRFTFRDIVRSALYLNVLAAVMYPINLVLGSNYLYLIGKPPPGTLYDILGPWPFYIVSIEFILLFLSILVLIPFKIYSNIYDK